MCQVHLIDIFKCTYSGKATHSLGPWTAGKHPAQLTPQREGQQLEMGHYLE